MAERGFEMAAENLPPEPVAEYEDQRYSDLFEDYLDEQEEIVHDRMQVRFEQHLEGMWNE